MQDVLCQFVSLLGHEGLKHQTIKCNLSGICFQNIAQSFPDNFIKDMPRLHYVLRGIKSEEAKRQAPTKQRLPVTPAILLKVYTVLVDDPSNFDNIMICAASLVCFFGFLCSGEITIPSVTAYDTSTHLSLLDISADIPLQSTVVQLRIKQSKTDPFQQGVNIYLGATNSTLCPLTALLNFLAFRGQADGPLFHFQYLTPLTKQRFTSSFRSLLQRAGIDSSQYLGHSFRIGAASTAAADGVEDSLIQTLGRWKSSAYLMFAVPPATLQLSLGSYVIISSPVIIRRTLICFLLAHPFHVFIIHYCIYVICMCI